MSEETLHLKSVLKRTAVVLDKSNSIYGWWENVVLLGPCMAPGTEWNSPKG